MEGLDVQAFISSQRAKLSREKERLSEDRTPRGILPSGNQAISRAANLRQERVSEYHDFLKGRERPAQFPSKSVAEIREEIAHDRRKELESGQSTSRPDSTSRERKRDGEYGSLKERRLAEERRYRGEVYDKPEIGRTSRKRWDDVETSYKSNKGSKQPPVMTRGYPQHWEEEEQGLMQWARNQNRSNSQVQRKRAPTPPTYESPYRRDDYSSGGDDRKSLRSISAPVMAGGLPGLGGGDDNPQAQRDKQRKYAEELRAQMRENEEARKRDKKGEMKPEVKLSPERTQVRSSVDRDIESKAYKRKSDEEYSRRAPRSPYRGDRQDRFTPYPPPPPPHFPDHPGYTLPQHGSYHPWMPPYYPPRRMYQQHEYPPPHSNPYYPPHPSYPHPMDNPYLPPHGPPPPLRRERWEEPRDSRKQRRLRYEDEVDVDGRSPLSPSQKENVSPRGYKAAQGEEHPSPLTGGDGKVSKQDKMSYKAELEKQMREKKERELKAKIEKERYELNKETEIYDPFGKGGCGAPVRDQHGNVVADLKHIHQINEERLNATTPSPSHSLTTERRPASAEISPRTILNYEKLDDVTQKKSGQENYREYLRQQVQEKEDLKRKEKEMKMLEEQREQERLAKEREKLREDYERELELQRMKEEETRLKNEEMKREAEQKRREAAFKVEEEQRREAEQERKAAEERNRSLTVRTEQPVPSSNQGRPSSPPIPTLRHKMNQFADPPHTPDRSQHNNAYRSSSPPVPALQHKQQQKQLHVLSSQEPISTDVGVYEPVVVRSSSPPVPALRKKQQQQQQPSDVAPLTHQEQRGQEAPGVAGQQPSSQTQPTLQTYRRESELSTRTQSRGSVPSFNQTDTVDSHPQSRQPSSDILTQLAAMRKHLQSQFAQQQQPPTGHGEATGRVWQQKPKLPAPRVRRQQQPGDSAVSSALNEFTNLKYHHPGRREFIEKFPKPPVSGSTLDVQQNALLRQQEQKLDRMKHQSSGLLSSESLQFPLESHPFQDGKQTLHTEHNGTSFHHTNIAGPSDGGGHKRKQWGGQGGRGGPRIPSAGGQSYLSVATFEVDSMAAKNEERARRLDAILNAGGSGGGGVQEPRTTHAKAQVREQDPQTILHNFLKRTGHGGPMSRQSEKSLDCETGFQQIDSLHS